MKELQRQREIILRKPVPGDIGWVISMHGLLYSQQFKFELNFEVDIAGKITSFFEKSHEFNRLLIAQVGGSRAGSIAISLKPDKSAFINFLLVKNEFRRRGIAKRLMEKVIEQAEEADLSVLRLETYSCLEQARALYEKYDFKPYKKIRGVERYGQVFDQEFWEKEYALGISSGLCGQERP